MRDVIDARQDFDMTVRHGESRSHAGQYRQIDDIVANVTALFGFEPCFFQQGFQGGTFVARSLNDVVDIQISGAF